MASQNYLQVSQRSDIKLWMIEYLVHHHDRQKVQEGREEEAIHVVLHIRANGLGQGVEQNLADNESCHTEADVPQRPTLLQGAHDQHSLHDNVDEEEDGGKDVDNHKQGDCALWA